VLVQGTESYVETDNDDVSNNDDDCIHDDDDFISPYRHDSSSEVSYTDDADNTDDHDSSAPDNTDDSTATTDNLTHDDSIDQGAISDSVHDATLDAPLCNLHHQPRLTSHLNKAVEHPRSGTLY
jgi:hypothetical protein